MTGPVSAGPTKTQLDEARIQSDESQLRYLLMVIDDMKVKETETAKWWSDYIGKKPDAHSP